MEVNKTNYSRLMSTFDPVEHLQTKVIANIIRSYISKSNLLTDYGGHALTNRDIAGITGLSKTSVDIAMSELVKARAFVLVDCGQSYMYFANPYIYTGEDNEILRMMFEDYEWKGETNERD